MRIAAVGECMIELSPDGQGGWRLGFAGDTFNTLWTVRGLLGDGATDYVSAFGDDDFSRQQLAFFARHGIGTAQSPTIAGGLPGLYAITLKGAERSFTYWRGDSVARHLADDTDRLLQSLDDRELVYFSGITLAILPAKARAALLEALGTVRAAGTRIAFDPNYRPRLWTSRAEAAEAIAAGAGLADIALPTFDDERELFGDVDPAATARRLAALGVGECVVKNGAGPALLLTKTESLSIDACGDARPVDTSGAGDAFNGGYLSARLRGAAPADSVKFAHRIAAVAIGERGALIPFEKLKAVPTAMER
ncbi:sugar kinase [Dongia sp.]|uniref:sugar kinase n=1 Tax=Dongia sp. TaxID=1977262 RepID=UPI0035B484CB